MAESSEETQDDQKQDDQEHRADDALNNEAIEEVFPKEFLEAIPEEDRGRVKAVISQMMISSNVRPRNPLLNKITSEHITSILSNSNQQDERRWTDKNWDRLYKGVIFSISMVVVLVVIYVLRDNQEALKIVMTALLSFGAGFGVGKIPPAKKDDDWVTSWTN